MLSMNPAESYEFLDWPLVSGQFQTGPSVQLPGSENLLPVQNGYLVDTTANLPEDIKQQSQMDDFLDITEDDDDWNCFGDVEISASGYFHDSDQFLCTSLPSSPEIASFDGIDLGSDLDLNANPCSSHQTKSVVLEDILDPCRLCDFDPPAWLLFPIPILPSLEEVESVLSASPPLDVVSYEDSLSPTGNETHSSEIDFAPVPLQFADAQLESIQLSGNPLNIFQTNNIGWETVAACSSVQAPQNMTWIESNAPGHSLGLYSGYFDFDSTSNLVTSDMVTSFDSLSPLGSSHGSSASDAEELSSVASPQPIRSSSVSVSLRVEPYPTTGVKPERRERKREQNKTAALKYRHKKRTEQGVFVSEREQLENRNSELKGRVEELTREISYLKGLMSEINSSQAE